MKRGCCKSGEPGVVRDQKGKAVVSKSVPKLKESIPSSPGIAGGCNHFLEATEVLATCGIPCTRNGRLGTVYV